MPDITIRGNDPDMILLKDMNGYVKLKMPATVSLRDNMNISIMEDAEVTIILLPSDVQVLQNLLSRINEPHSTKVQP